MKVSTRHLLPLGTRHWACSNRKPSAAAHHQGRAVMFASSSTLYQVHLETIAAVCYSTSASPLQSVQMSLGGSLKRIMQSSSRADHADGQGNNEGSHTIHKGRR